MMKIIAILFAIGILAFIFKAGYMVYEILQMDFDFDWTFSDEPTETDLKKQKPLVYPVFNINKN